MNILIGLLLVVSCTQISTSAGCNKALCASDVSKCLLQELCQCQVTEAGCSCCRECMLCLGPLWEQCCKCTGLCKDKHGKDTQHTSLSYVDDLLLPIPSLFQTLATVPDNDGTSGWTYHVLPVSDEVNQQEHENHILLGSHKVMEAVIVPPVEDTTDNCTVLYFNTCVSITRCKQSCELVGASKYRWFQNGCCECIGCNCIAYGSKELGCQSCKS
ncbi:twisted gastrulation protein homolog 1-like [Protopterus annectens]|uniref:twisted gastrulation protein homolog 1-like n=1 Tax=Protopterus annectens TaxID=7888 RepID=UPI001CFA0628|nr:twisted gastrulation protein homolog 1-like [Protopterus annectens]